ncbi:histidine phosphatase superfamily [Gymnopilus junonius]|uniref:Histidine phosphatase superfamily n=1 Tax=Gymnopilus junonius TaxID=109634 RepID=A0A9P5NRR8_GYMJU|nr:histidine phosphatase superfamily [Gymnopilus junonius]
MVSFILVRHGESKDNLRQVWAGWKDSPLSNHGIRQAEALAEYFNEQNVLLNAVYASDLTRAKTTAKVVKDKQPHSHSIPFEVSELLREQNFGSGEGKHFAKKDKNLSLASHYARGMFPALHTRNGTFPGGESLDDVARRAEEVIDTLLSCHLIQEGADGKERAVAVFSHGIFIGELVAAITRRDNEFASRGGVDVRGLRGMSNTGWTRLEVTIKTISEDASIGSKLQFSVKANGVDRHPHLANLHRQKGGIGSMAHDPAQQDIRSFLGGKQKTASKSTTRPKPY